MSIGIDFGSEERPSVRSQATREAEAPSFRVAIMGNFSGRSSLGPNSKLADRQPILIDRDNLESVMERLEVGLVNRTLSPDGEQFSIEFREIDDFHPDSLYRNLKLFDTFRTVRNQLQDPQLFSSAAAIVRSWLSLEDQSGESPESPAREAGTPNPPKIEEAVDSENLLDQILAQDSDAKPAERGHSQWQDVIHEIVAPHSQPGADPELPEMLACLDSMIASSMTQLLHSTEFRTLESHWRLLQKVVRSVETGRQCKIYLLDITREELIQSIKNAGSVDQSELFRSLNIEFSWQTQWDLIVSTECFSYTVESADLLSRLGLICLSTEGLLLAAADASHVGWDQQDPRPDESEWKKVGDAEANEIWNRVKSSSLGNGIGLFWPNVLVRLPYGEQTSPIEAFNYEEFNDSPQHDELLWGSPALLAIILYARAITIPAEELRAEDLQIIERMPLLIFKSDQETMSYPCSECFLNELAIQKVIEAGLSPIISIRNEDAIRFPKIRSLNGSSLLS